MKPRLIIGLGNVGEQYADTRHNLGINAVRHFVNQMQANAQVSNWTEDTQSEAELAQINITPANSITCLFPQTNMNESGRAVSKYLRYHELDQDELLIVHDDLELPLGEYSYSIASAKGHNGVRSIHKYLNSIDIPRLRLGIGRTQENQEVHEYVLSKFTSEEQPKVAQIIEQAADKLVELVK